MNITNIVNFNNLPKSFRFRNMYIYNKYKFSNTLKESSFN